MAKKPEPENNEQILKLSIAAGAGIIAGLLAWLVRDLVVIAAFGATYWMISDRTMKDFALLRMANEWVNRFKGMFNPAV